MADSKKYSRLPDAYQEVEYIQSGILYLQTGYIDTGLVGTDLYGCEFEICMKVVVSTNANFYYLNGAYESGQTTQTGLIREDTEYVHSVVNMGFNTASYSGSIALNDWHTIYTSDGIQKTDGIIVSNETYGTFNNLRYLLFARTDTDVTLSPPFAMKYFWIKKNGQYIRNMIPAKRKSDNVVGMYDIANDVFYTSENQYAFIGGDAVDYWQHSLRKLTTATDTLTTLPAVLYPNDTTATVGLKGNTVQNGTPTPSSPIMPQGTGDLETVGAKAGQYKIPILSNSQTTNVYLGEAESTRQVKKLVLTGEENWTKNDVGNPSNYLYYQTGYLANKTCVCSHLVDMGTLSTSKVGVFNGNNVLYLNFGSAIMNVQPSGNTVEGLKEYLAAQYAAGTPVTVWYVLATETTGIVNEPLMKIGDYADTVSGITIPTITSKDTFDVDTTLKPSEVSLSYTGWHDATVEEWDGSQWQ